MFCGTVDTGDTGYMLKGRVVNGGGSRLRGLDTVSMGHMERRISEQLVNGWRGRGVAV